jgi:hypothetical protein
MKAVLAAFAAGALPCVALPYAAAPQTAQPEYEVKARFLLQFPEFVSWPPSTGQDEASRPFVILVLGDSPFGGYLDAAARGRKVQGRPVEVRYARDLAAIEGCQMVFVCASERGHLAAILPRAGARGALTIADTDGFAERGVMINLVIESNLPRFEINRASAKAAGLSLSAQILGLARKVF